MRDQILRALAGSSPADDPAAAALAGLKAPVARRLFSAPLIPAAVLVPLVEQRAGLSILLTRRTDHLNVHAGQISFPGGRVDPGDAGPVATALREAAEEVGILAEQVRIVGFLPAYPVVTGFAVTPVVGLLEPPLNLRLDDFEVAEAFEVPLEFFLDPAQRRSGRRRVRDVEIDVVEYQFADYRIWGATAQMIDTLVNIIKNKSI